MMDSLIARALARKPLKPGRNLVAFLTTTTDQQRTAFDGGPSSSPSSRVLPKTTPVQGVVNNDDCINSMGTTVPAGGVAANVTGEQQQKQSIKPLVFFT
jgi:hypothetical protein